MCDLTSFDYFESVTSLKLVEGESIPMPIRTSGVNFMKWQANLAQLEPTIRVNELAQFIAQTFEG
jgi:hypothetical protein